MCFGAGGRRGNVDVCDIADVDMSREEVERGDVEVLEDKLDFGVDVLGSKKNEGQSSQPTSPSKNVPRNRNIFQKSQKTWSINVE